MANKLVANLSGGMNTKTSPLLLKDTECELILNYHLDEVGALTKRNGYDVFSSQPVDGKTCLGLFQFNDTSGSEDNPLMVANVANDANAVIYEEVSGTWTSRDTTGTASVKHRFATFLDYVFRVNGSNTVLTSNDLSTWSTTLAPATITPSFIAVFQDRVYVARNGTTTPNANRVYFSSLPSGTTITWTTGTDFFDVNPDDGDEITALENNGNRLLIFKRRALYRWNFAQTEPDRLIGTGTQSQECVKTNLDLGITFFANEYGAFAYSGGRPKLISRKIQQWFDNVPAGDVDDFYAETDADHYYLYLSDSMTINRRTYTNVMAVYTVSLDAWTIYTLHTPVRFMAKLLQSSSEDIYFGSTVGRTYQFNSGASDDSGGASENAAIAIAGEIVFKEQLLNMPNKSQLEFVDFISREASSVGVQFRLDRKGDWLSAPGNLVERINSLKLKGQARTIQLRVTDNAPDQKPVIEGYNLQFNPLPKRL